MAGFLSSFSNLKLGLLLVIAIAIHNIREGIAVSVPIYHATLSKTKVIKYVFISGIAEPVGAIIVFLNFSLCWRSFPPAFAFYKQSSFLFWKY